MAHKSLETLLHEELKDIYDAEHQVLEALPQMKQAVTNRELKSAFQDHLDATKRQIERLEQIFGMMGQAPSRKPCKGMRGLVKEGEDLMQELEGATLDAALIAAAQKVEHYEIASYGSARTWADQIGMRDVSDLLQQTLDEEGTFDHHLTSVAKNINPKAEQASR